jgi:hypothetical protein
MPTFNVKVDATDLVKGLSDLQKNQLPYAMAKALTATAKDAQTSVQASLSEKFHLRNNWTKQGIRVKPAEKKEWPITADVHSDTSNRSTGAPDYLGLQEDGGEKVPINGRHHLAIPTKYLRRMVSGVIPQELRPRNLLGAVSGRFAGRNRKGQLALKNQKLVNGFEFFLFPNPQNPKWIMGRYFTDRDAYPFYVLVPAGRVKPTLQMQKTVENIVNDRFARNWDVVWQDIMSKGLRF